MAKNNKFKFAPGETPNSMRAREHRLKIKNNKSKKQSAKISGMKSYMSTFPASPTQSGNTAVTELPREKPQEHTDNRHY
ncbi:216_t:CDS:1, partial [Racocetra fulgida]